MRTGRMDRQIAIQSVSTAQNSYGEEIETWTDVATVWASRESQRATERFAAQQRYATIDAIWTIRFNEDWTPAISPKTHRVVFESRTYEILGVLEIGREEGVQLITKARGE